MLLMMPVMRDWSSIAHVHVKTLHSSSAELLLVCRILKEERNYTLQLVKKIAKSGCNVLLIQKSILRDATSDLSLHFLVREPCHSCVKAAAQPDKLCQAGLIGCQTDQDSKAGCCFIKAHQEATGLLPVLVQHCQCM